MADMLVKLFNISYTDELESKLSQNGIRIKRALAPDRSRVVEFSKTASDHDYSDEVNAAFANNPVTCYIATRGKELLGFACFEATAKDFFGPMAVSEKERKKGIGRALLLRSLLSMQEMGYAYGIIGWPATTAIPFYEKCVNAEMIKEKSSGVYQRMIGIDE